MTGAPNQYEIRLCRVLAYIYDNLDGDLSLDALADVACLSRFHFHRVFRAMTGDTLAEAIRRIRLLRAANALVTDEEPIGQIARRCGYSSLAGFSRAFRTAHGVSPAAFRKSGVRLANTLPANHGDGPMHPVTIQTLKPARAAGVAHKGPYPQIATAFHKLGAILASHRLLPHATGMVALYHDAPGARPEAELSSHAAVLLGEGFPAGVPGLDYMDIAGGRYAVLEHQGPYATLGAAYDSLYGQWLPNSGEEPRDAPPLEVYVNDPSNTPAAQLRTDIRLPLR